MAEIKAKKGESKELREKKEKKNNSEKLFLNQIQQSHLLLVLEL